MKRIPTLFACLLLVAAWGCRPRAPELDTRTYPLERLLPHEAEAIVRPYVYNDRETNPGTMSVSNGALTVRETPDNLDKIARVLAEYDAGREDVRLQFQLVEAGDFQADDPRIATVEAQLRELFDHRGYRLVGEALSTATGGGQVVQTLGGTDGPYEIRAGIWRPSADVIRLEDVGVEGADGVGLTTTVNVRPGQTLVLGSSTSGEGGNTLFLAVRAEVTGG